MTVSSGNNVMPFVFATHHYPAPHGGGGLIATFMHSLVSSLAWHAGGMIAHLLGGWLIVIAIVVVIVYFVRRWRR